MITVSRLLKSCAIPPASRPIASIFWACRRSRLSPPVRAPPAALAEIAGDDEQAALPRTSSARALISSGTSRPPGVRPHARTTLHPLEGARKLIAQPPAHAGARSGIDRPRRSAAASRALRAAAFASSTNRPRSTRNMESAALSRESVGALGFRERELRPARPSSARLIVNALNRRRPARLRSVAAVRKKMLPAR